MACVVMTLVLRCSVVCAQFMHAVVLSSKSLQSLVSPGQWAFDSII